MKFIKIIALIMLSLFILSFCSQAGRQEQEQNSTDINTEYYDVFNEALASIVALDDKTIEHLESVYKDQCGHSLYLNEFTANLGDYLEGTFCYGNFDSCIVVFCPTMLAVETSITIADEVFSYGSSFTIECYHEGTFYPLDEAYEKGFITKKEVAITAERHRKIQNYNSICLYLLK